MSLRFKSILAIPAVLVMASAQVAPPPAAPPAQSDVVIHATTRLIQVNVIVHDNHGQPVRGLTKDDFHLTDNGKPQQIAIFSMDSNACCRRPKNFRRTCLPTACSRRALYRRL